MLAQAISDGTANPSAWICPTGASGVSRVAFILPALGKLRSFPPTGEGWQYELKFGGWRGQLHKAGQTAAIYGKNGGDLTRRFPTIDAAVLALAV
jgi:ATP-dependent DNA ligase